MSLGILSVPVCPADPFHPQNDMARKLNSIVKDSKSTLILTDFKYLTALKAAELVNHEVYLILRFM